ncbi:MAG: hypothetical protein V4673_18435 [Pseudomonadota bacterium]
MNASRGSKSRQKQAGQKQDLRPGKTPQGPSAEPIADPIAATRAPVATSPGTTEDYAHRLVWLPEAVALLRREPAVAIPLGYLLLSLIGLWSSFCFYRVFRIPILEYLQPADFLVEGVRHPVNLLWLLAMLAIAVPAYWPTYYRLHHPERAEHYRKRWYGRVIFSRLVDPFRRRRWYDISPEATIAFALLVGGGSLILTHARQRAGHLLGGGGEAVRVTLSGESTPLHGTARLLGTSSGYVYLYWPANGRTEALVQENVSRIEILPRRMSRASVSPANAP